MNREIKGVHMDKKLIVITGAAGMIGSGVVRHLNDQGINNLLLVDDLGSDDRWKNLLGKKFCDLIRINDLFPFLDKSSSKEQISSFIHLGACSDTLEKNGKYLMENNYRYSVDLARYALLNDKKFIYASSAATYGNGEFGFADDIEALETLRPLNFYGFSKHLFDLWAKKEKVIDSLVGLKYFNVFGPNENHKGHMASMVYKMVPLVQEKGVLTLFRSTEPDRFKDGEQCRDFIYVKDAARLTCEFLSNKLGGIFNVGRGETVSWNRLARAVFSALGVPEKIEYIDMPETLKKQYQNYTCAEMGRLIEGRETQRLGALCNYSLEEAVKEYVTQYLIKDERW